jgi:hypothetical protein
MKLYHLIVPLLVVFALFLPIGVSYDNITISNDLFTYGHNYYKLEETGFNYASEVYGSLSFTTGTAPSSTLGIINNGQSFNGVDDIIRTINSSSLQMQEIFICVWVYLTDSATSKYFLKIVI